MTAALVALMLAAGAEPPERIVVQAKLVRATPVPDPATLRPYRSALVADLYEVTAVERGRCRHRRILVVRRAIRDGKVIAARPPLRPGPWGHLAAGLLAGGPGGARAVPAAPGSRLVLERFDDHKELATEKLLLDTEEIDLPLYVDVG